MLVASVILGNSYMLALRLRIGPLLVIAPRSSACPETTTGLTGTKLTFPLIPDEAPGSPELLDYFEAT